MTFRTRSVCAFIALVAGAWLATQLVAQRPPAAGNIAISVHEGTMIAIALSPDKQTLAMDLQGTLFTLPAKGGQANRITDELYDARQPDWSLTAVLSRFNPTEMA